MFHAGGPVPEALGSDVAAQHRTHRGSLPPGEPCTRGAGEANGGHPPVGCGGSSGEWLSLSPKHTARYFKAQGWGLQSQKYSTEGGVTVKIQYIVHLPYTLVERMYPIILCSPRWPFGWGVTSVSRKRQVLRLFHVSIKAAHRSPFLAVLQEGNFSCEQSHAISFAMSFGGTTKCEYTLWCSHVT